MVFLPKRPHAGPREDAAGKAGPCQSLPHRRERKIRALGVRFGVYDGLGRLSLLSLSCSLSLSLSLSLPLHREGLAAPGNV